MGHAAAYNARQAGLSAVRISPGINICTFLPATSKSRAGRISHVTSKAHIKPCAPRLLRILAAAIYN